jgi:hypothetical protein
MADNHAYPAGHPDMDYAEHEKTYGLFLSLLKYGSIFVVLIIILLAVFTI